MQSYETRIRLHASRLADSFAAKKLSETSVNKLVYNFTFSIMRDFAFSQQCPDEYMQWKASLAILHQGLALLGPLSPMPWIALFAFHFEFIPIVRDFNRMLEFCKSCFRDRLKENNRDKIDIADSLINHARSNKTLGTPEEIKWQDGDAFGVMLAGSDTTAVTIIISLYYLARFRRHQRQLREELHRAGETWQTDLKMLEGLPLLNGIINESLRLWHLLPTAGGRVVSSSGMTIGGTYLAPETILITPRFSYGRLEVHYGKSTEFIPERWFSKPELVKDRNAFTPWSRGKGNCLGQALALQEIRCVLALVVTRFAFRFPPDDDGSSVLGDFRDRVTAAPGNLNLIFDSLSKIDASQNYHTEMHPCSFQQH